MIFYYYHHHWSLCTIIVFVIIIVLVSLSVWKTYIMASRTLTSVLVVSTITLWVLWFYYLKFVQPNYTVLLSDQKYWSLFVFTTSKFGKSTISMAMFNSSDLWLSTYFIVRIFQKSLWFLLTITLWYQVPHNSLFPSCQLSIPPGGGQAQGWRRASTALRRWDRFGKKSVDFRARLDDRRTGRVL